MSFVWKCRYCKSTGINLNKGGRFDDYPDKCDICYWKDKALFAEQQLFQIRTILYGVENPEAPPIDSDEIVIEVGYLKRLVGDLKGIIEVRQRKEPTDPAFYIAKYLDDRMLILTEGPFKDLDAITATTGADGNVIVMKDGNDMKPILNWINGTGWGQ